MQQYANWPVSIKIWQLTPHFARKKKIKLRGKFLHHSKHHTMARMLREFIFSLRELLPDMATLDSFHCALVLMMFLYLLHLYPDFMCMPIMTIRVIPRYILRLGPDQTQGPDYLRRHSKTLFISDGDRHGKS